MANPRCETCGSTMARFENPERYKCPTPERHRLGPLKQGVTRNPNKGIRKGTKNPKGGKGK